MDKALPEERSAEGGGQGRQTAMKEVQAPCSSCIRTTAHKVLCERSLHDEDRTTTYAMLECSGCHRVCLGERVLFIPDGDVEYSFYPSPVSRKEPDWLLSLIVERDAVLGSLLHEIYQAVYGGQFRLAAMGIRALLEQVMVAHMGDLGSFDGQLDEFQKAGYISKVQRETLHSTIQVGHAAMHRAYKPTEEDIKVALDIVEGVMAPLYAHQKRAERMVDRVPPRPPRKR
jgi:Domain of unknown function (DUF4145)